MPYTNAVVSKEVVTLDGTIAVDPGDLNCTATELRDQLSTAIGAAVEGVLATCVNENAQVESSIDTGIGKKADATFVGSAPSES